MVCSSLNDLINDCTVILGWCYTSEDVNVTKEKQRGLLNKAMKKILPEFDVEVKFDDGVMGRGKFD